MIAFFGKIFAYLMSICYKLIGDYGWSIVFFTFVAKVIQLPISIMVQINSIKMVKMYPEMNMIKAKFFGSSDLISEENYKLYKKHDYHPMYDLIPVIVQLIILMGVVEGLKAFDVSDTMFLGIDLGAVPSKVGGKSILIPVVAAVSAWLMCFTQNLSNVLQSEQGKANKMITMGISVGLSLYLGFFVQGGVGLYWIVGNILAIIQMYILNFCINPKKHIDYEALAESKKELDKVSSFAAANKKKVDKEFVSKEKEDIKRFNKFGYKQIVFYSEKNGFYKYFANVIEYILAKTDIIIHYITNDPKDEVFNKVSDNFRVYYMSENKLIVQLMKLEADICVMTTPDLQKYHIKKSMVDDVEYIYMDHAIGSVNMTFRKHAFDAFDTIFVPNDITYNEFRAQEAKYGLEPKELVKVGYGLIDNMIEAYKKSGAPANDPKEILIAPSWQQDNLMDLCIEPMLDSLLGNGWHVVVRPHPQYVRHFEDKLEALRDRYKGHGDFELQTDFSSNKTVFNADVMITDWSGIAYEYSFTTLKPTLFINTPMKVMNPDYKEIDIEPFDITVRDEIGISVDPDRLDTLADTVRKLLNDNEYTPESLEKVRDQYLYNIGESGEVGGKYIIRKLIEYSKK